MRRKSDEPTATMPLGDLIAPLPATQRLNWDNVPVESISDDSRRVGPGALFVAVLGELTDGHRFIGEAAQRGAAAIVCQNLPQPLPPCPVIQVADARWALSALASVFYGHPSRALRVIGVTGTDGKTTTTELCRAILTEAGRRTGSLGTVKYSLGDHVIESDQTTPHPLLLHAMLQQSVRAGLTDLCMEVSSHALVHRRTSHVQFDAAVLTNVTEDHLDFHKSPEAYVRAKQCLFEQLPERAVAVLNADSPVCKAYSRATQAVVVRFGVRERAEVTLELKGESIQGMQLLVRTPAGRYPVRTPLTGRHNCENILAAAALAFAFSIETEAVQHALERFKGVPGRLEKIDLRDYWGLPNVVVDYAHTPNALRRVLETLRELTCGKLICVFGCGGNRETQKRPAMGGIAASLADLVVVTSDNSRDESTDQIIAQIVQGVPQARTGIMIEPNRRAAIELALANARSPDDTVAICGRGCERVQVLGARRIPFDDRVVAREALRHRFDTRKRSA